MWASWPQAWQVSGCSEWQVLGPARLVSDSARGRASMSARRATTFPGLPVSIFTITLVVGTSSQGRPSFPASSRIIWWVLSSCMASSAKVCTFRRQSMM